jgi:hypothetical protein
MERAADGLALSGHGMIAPRCWQTAASARIVPSSPRTTSTGSPATSVARQSPGAATCSILPMQIQLRLNTSACSKAKNSGAV